MSRALETRLPPPPPPAPISGDNAASFPEGTPDEVVRAEVVDRLTDRLARHAADCARCAQGRECPLSELIGSVLAAVERVRAELAEEAGDTGSADAPRAGGAPHV